MTQITFPSGNELVLSPFDLDPHYGVLNEEEFEEMLQDTADLGLEVVRRQPNQILLDLDDKEAAYWFNNHFQLIEERYEAKIERIWTSKSGKGLHVVVTLNVEVDTHQALFLQATMGSDRKREFLGQLLHDIGEVTNPIVLFRPLNTQDFESLKDAVNYLMYQRG